ncbi:uncharacterized protein SAPINGB_P006397 [Magnusiomyces paraingens]|uniref:NADH-ubiquinone oxidoreductase 9.5 kDa subunit n=1 Tax=Magnusiomyces paraingens TaxID=2606893 RepID=A0A5E8C4R4_9ASCO|nr:uncharacterized protein SAPINGB_P006397 [Saprochaete ingens]VVT58814.1 unnamed protein product [Saprochaete ingens]
MVKPDFWAQPLRYIRWSAHEQPTLFYTVIIGAAGPLFALTLTPLRRKYLFADAPEIPLTYPLPQARNKELAGYDDE